MDNISKGRWRLRNICTYNKHSEPIFIPISVFLMLKVHEEMNFLQLKYFWNVLVFNLGLWKIVFKDAI